MRHGRIDSILRPLARWRIVFAKLAIALKASGLPQEPQAALVLGFADHSKWIKPMPSALLSPCFGASTMRWAMMNTANAAPKATAGSRG